jgi:hypothetical protein
MLGDRPSDPIPRSITFWDRMLGAVLLGAALVPLALAPSAGRPASVSVVITAAGGAISAPIERNLLRRVRGPLGETVVELSGGKVRVRSSPCPNQICVGEGWRQRPGEVIICVPNRVGVFVTGGEEEVDAITR